MSVSALHQRETAISSVTQSRLTLCDPMDCSMPGLPVHHQLLEFMQTHVHWVGNAIQPSHLLSSPSPVTFNLSQHRGLCKWVSSSYQMGKVLELQFQHPVLPVNIQDWFPVGWDGLVWSPCSPGNSQESSPALQFKSISCFGAQPSL